MIAHRIGLVAVIVLFSTVKAEDDPTIWRINDNVLPNHYDINIMIPNDYVDSKSFTGSVNISLMPKRTEKKTEVKQITLHSVKDTNITTITLNDGENEISILPLGKKDPQDTPNTWSLNEETSIMTINLEKDLNHTNNYILAIDYTGLLREDFHGPYLITYNSEDGKKETSIVTQFEPNHAREVFPCFDEPSFKASFKLKLTIPDTLNALSNTDPKNIVADTAAKSLIYTFKQTPIMSTYMVAFIASKYNCTENPTDETFQVCSNNEAKDFRQLAAHQMSNLMNNLNKLFPAMNYSTNENGINKMTMAITHDFQTGAMENWGLIAFREPVLLYDEAVSTVKDYQSVLTIMAHKFTHQWFGDLVTMDWWTNTFLNEGFGRFFEHYSFGDTNEMELEKQFVVNIQQNVMIEDAETATYLTKEVNAPSEIEEKFAFGITYDKGACVQRMISHVMEYTYFISGINSYLNANQNKNTNPSNLWEHLSKFSDVDIAKFATNWVDQPGYPVIDVELKKDTGVSLTQNRFRFTKNDNDTTVWHVPLTFTTSDNPEFEVTKPKPEHIMTEKTMEIDNIVSSKKSWIIFNTQASGYYRVNYNNKLWENIIKGLKKSQFSNIHVLNRAQLVDDVLNLARAGLTSYENALNLISYLEAETEYYPWQSAQAGLKFILNRLTGKVQDQLKEFILSLTHKLYKEIEFSNEDESNHVFTLKQMSGLSWLCSLGHEKCNTEAKKHFDIFLKDPTTKPSRNLKSVVYCAGLRIANSTIWDVVFDTYTKSKVAFERDAIAASLGCSTDSNILNGYLSKIFEENSKIHTIQDAENVFLAVIKENTFVGVDVVLEYLTNNLDQVNAYFKVSNQGQNVNNFFEIINTLANGVTTEDQLNKFKALKGESTDVAFEMVRDKAASTIKANLEWTKSASKEISDYLKSVMDVPSTTT